MEDPFELRLERMNAVIPSRRPPFEIDATVAVYERLVTAKAMLETAFGCQNAAPDLAVALAKQIGAVRWQMEVAAQQIADALERRIGRPL